jgi:membrane-bound metal-dependent hydrolase YbcI (DUF457 family)
VPSPLAHYAIGAAGLHAFEMPRRRLALLSLWAVAPDLDALPAIAWTLLAPHLDLGADALRFGANLLGHRGFSHTFLAAGLAALVVWLVTRRRREALAAGLAWSLHVVLDTLTDWSTIPFWPLSDRTYMVPLVTGLDPLLTLASIGTIAALLGPVVADELGWPGPRKRARLERWGRRWGKGLAFASAGAVLFSAATVGWTAAASDAGQALPANAPRTAALDRPADAEAEAWNVTTRWTPVADGDTRQIPYVANASAEAPDDAIADAECALANMGPFAPVDEPAWKLRQEDGVWIAQAQDLVRNATGTGGPHVHVALADGTVEAAWVTGGAEDEDPWYRATIPSVLWEEAGCL